MLLLGENSRPYGTFPLFPLKGKSNVIGLDKIPLPLSKSNKLISEVTLAVLTPTKRPLAAAILLPSGDAFKYPRV